MKTVTTIVLVVYTLLEITTTKTDAHLISGVAYKIRNGYDGTVLTAQNPTFANDLSLKLGKVTTEDWYRAENQLWQATLLQNRTTTSNSSQPNTELFWLKSKAAVLNELTGVPRDRENPLEITEIAQNSGTFLVRNVQNNSCLASQGIGLEVAFNKCNELNAAQQWDFEDPLNPLKFKNRLDYWWRWFNKAAAVFLIDFTDALVKAGELSYNSTEPKLQLIFKNSHK